MEFLTEAPLELLEDGGHFFIRLPFEAAAFFAEKGQKRAVCRLNDAVDVHFHLFKLKPSGEAVAFLNRDAAKFLKARKGQTVRAVFRLDESEFGWPMPEELAEVLATDDAARAAFDSLTPGAKRTILVRIGGIKNPEKRIEKALSAAEKLKSGERSAILIVR